MEMKMTSINNKITRHSLLFSLIVKKMGILMIKWGENDNYHNHQKL